MTEKQFEVAISSLSSAIEKAGSVSKLCEEVGVGRTSVYRWLNGEYVMSVPIAKKMAAFSQMSLRQFRPDIFDDESSVSPT